MNQHNLSKFAILGGIGLLFIFYWFIIRPEQIRRYCYKYAYSTPNLGDTKEWNQATSYYYYACLNRSGLAK